MPRRSGLRRPTGRHRLRFGELMSAIRSLPAGQLRLQLQGRPINRGQRDRGRPEFLRRQNWPTGVLQFETRMSGCKALVFPSIVSEGVGLNTRSASASESSGLSMPCNPLRARNSTRTESDRLSAGSGVIHGPERIKCPKGEYEAEHHVTNRKPHRSPARMHNRKLHVAIRVQRSAARRRSR